MAIPLLGDENISQPLAGFLRGRGHDIILTNDLGLRRATDGLVLLTAVRLGRLLLTHNERDFVLLHDAWLRWSAEWGIVLRHRGVVVLPQAQRWEWARSAAEIEGLTAGGGDATPIRIEHNLWVWRAKGGWIEFAAISRGRPEPVW